MKISRKQDFTLIEIVIAIVVLGILASIITMNVKDSKRDAFIASVENNMRNLQTASDHYMLKHQEYPTFQQPTLTKPQEINFETLYPSYIKNKPKDLNKVHYWIDSHGKVWAATEPSPQNLFVSDSSISWVHRDKVASYNMYEVEGTTVTSSLLDTFKLKKHIEVLKGTNRVQYSRDSQSENVLISSIDEYGLESAPAGIYEEDSFTGFTPIIGKEATLEFSLNGEETMYWISYKARESKPEGTSIIYSFSYLKEDGTYSEWTEDFTFLKPAKSMKVKIQTKGYKGTYPSVHSFQVYFTYKDQQDSIIPFKPVLKDNLDDTGKVIDPEQPVKITYEAKIEEPIFDLFIPGISIISNPPHASYLQKEDGQTVFTEIPSLEDVKPGSTIRIVIDYPKGEYIYTEPPVVLTNPSVQVQKESPSSTSSERWETIQTMTFVAHSGDGEKTEWLEAKIVDKQPEGTRITYEYLASQNGLSFGYRTDDIKKLPHSQSAMVIVKKMVRKDLVGKLEPELTSLSLIHTKGVADLDLIRPTLAIIPKKSNNKNSEFFSTDTVVTWDYEAYDPRNKQIVDVEWRGTVLTKYTVGKYTVQARVQNERGDWSNWVSYTFEVKPEQPIAKITMTPESGITSKTKINWGYSTSIDPDGDKIVNAEWQNQQSIYPFGGNQTVRLRVQDEEGNWSEWVEKSFYVTYITSIKTANFSIYNGIAITDEGQIMTWGKKDPNLLGYEVVADNVDYATPVILSSPLNVRDISSSNSNVLALTASGEVYSWGKNAYGETGLGHLNEVHTPQKIEGLPPIKKVLTAYTTSYAIAENGDVYGWGRNYGYKLPGTTYGVDNPTPIKINGLSNIKDIAQGSNMAIAIDNNGKTFVWGFNSNYQLGIGTTGTQATPLLHPYLQDKQAVGLIAHDLTVSILLSNGKVMSWGDYANYGTGYATSTKVPVELIMPDVKKLVRTHYGVFALTTDGQVYGWGRNVEGFSTSLKDIKTPQPILFSAEKVINITGGQHGYETYLYTEQGKVYGFGTFVGLVEMKAKNSGDSSLPILTPATHTLIGQ